MENDDGSSMTAAAQHGASKMLEMMIQSTNQLDEILQEMCAKDGTEAQDSNGSFKDCIDGTRDVSPETYHQFVEESPTPVKKSSSGPAKQSVLQKMQLSELLTASLYGKHDNVPSSDGVEGPQAVTSPSKASTFRKLHIETPLPRNRIVHAACSRYHTLFLSEMGLVFAYGHVMDGALGLGPECQGYVAKPTMVDFFLENLIAVKQVACGGDHLVGAHSAAVSQDGNLFTWGAGVALGNGTLRSEPVPQRIDIDTNAARATATVAAISCGSGFCVALTTCGQAFSWGKWSDGRLGLGPTPIIARSTRRQGGGAARKQFQFFQLAPRQIRCTLTDGKFRNSESGDVEVTFLKISCGDAHCVALTGADDLITWGRGSSGQLGLGDVSDSVSPTMVFQRSDNCGGRPSLRWKDAAAGENWSMALSSDGNVWSWGACGGAVLGHGLYGNKNYSLIAETILQHHRRLLAMRKKSSPTSSPSLPRLKWMEPRPIPCFSTSDIRICSLSAGVQHAAAVSENGDLYMWGEDYGEDDVNGAVFSSLPSLINSGGSSLKPTDDADGSSDIGSHIVSHIICGGRQAVAFSSGDVLARSLNKFQHGSAVKFVLGDELSTDTVIVAEEQSIRVHRCVLVARSEYFRALLAFQESPLSTNTNPNIINVEESFDETMRVLQFIYYDQLVLPELQHANEGDDGHGTSHQLLDDLVVADKYGLDRMKRLCEHAISLTVANCVDVLAVAELVHAAHLKQVVMRFIQTHLAEITARKDEFLRFQTEFPDLLHELYSSLREASQDEFLLRQWHKAVEAGLSAEREEKQLQLTKRSRDATFPWTALSLSLAFGVMYLTLMNAQEHEFSFVPATNIAAICGIGGVIMMGWL